MIYQGMLLKLVLECPTCGNGMFVGKPHPAATTATAQCRTPTCESYGGQNLVDLTTGTVLFTDHFYVRDWENQKDVRAHIGTFRDKDGKQLWPKEATPSESY